MITRLQLLKYIGPFDSVDDSTNPQFEPLTVIYAENGRGKTMLSSIFRSLATGEPNLIDERSRLGTNNTPHVVINFNSGSQCVFQNGGWNHSFSDIALFDDSFVDQNVFSGLAVEPAHRQHLHELILGSQGVALNSQLRQLVEKIQVHNQSLQTKGNAIPAVERGIMSVDDFCALKARLDINEEIRATERTLLVAKEQDIIHITPTLETLALPDFDVEEIENVLLQDLPSLDATALTCIQVHLASLGQGGESWISDGMERVPTDEMCPFCSQSLEASPVFTHYRAYFSEAYTEHKKKLSQTKAAIAKMHSGDAAVEFERAVRVLGERLQFWSRFCDVPDMALDTEAITRDWRTARENVEDALSSKQAAPLDRKTLSPEALDSIERFKRHVRKVSDFNLKLQEIKEVIGGIKDRPMVGDLRTLEDILIKLKSTKARHLSPTANLCGEYLTERKAKLVTEGLRDNARTNLNRYQTEVFPQYEDVVNRYLDAFNAGFRLRRIKAQGLGSGTGSVCNYNIIINNSSVPVAGGRPVLGRPSFGNTLSSGDRNTLALAFFFASLEQDTTLPDKIIVIDDPMTSLDEHRALTTVQEIRRLCSRTAQVIVLSHNKSFLYSIWKNSDKQNRAAFELRRYNAGSTIAIWDVHKDCITSHDRRHTLLTEYLGNQLSDKQRQVAESIRPHLESFLRVAYPLYFPPGSLLGHFLGRCDQMYANGSPILSIVDTTELRNLVEYANLFHHDTNTAWQTERINDGELLGFVKKTLEFVKRSLSLYPDARYSI